LAPKNIGIYGMDKKFIIFFIIGATSCSVFRSPSDLITAQDYENSARYNEAIEAYQKHINLRQKIASVDENPFFYYLMIGDNYLKLGLPEKALKAYRRAYNNKVESSFIVDRIKSLANFYSKLKNYDKAISILNEYRYLDIDAIDYEVDRIHKLMIECEDQKLEKHRQ
jgi:tetratricopeptide (TPR) repeat protein